MDIRLAATRGPTLVPRVFFELLRNDPRHAVSDTARWLRSFFAASLDPASPWLAYPTLRWLDATLRRDMTVFEYGAGASTLYFAKRVDHVLSVEHDAAWHAIVQRRLAEAGVDNVTLVHAAPEPSPPVEYDCERFASAAPGFERMTFERYVKTIDSQADDSLDLVLVDGRARASCGLRAWRHVRPNGFLLLDDSERPEYTPLHLRFDRHERVDLVGIKDKALELSRTTIWRKR